MADPGEIFRKSADESLRIVSNTETLWLTAPPTSDIRKHLKVKQLEALYEAAYLRIFAAWENFLEASTIRFMAGKKTTGYIPSPTAGSRLYRTNRAARAALYGSSQYLLWHNAGTVVKRVQGHLVGCPIELVVAGNAVRIQQFADIRHSIAHSSEDSKAKFAQASAALTGNRFLSAGRLLRSDDISDPMNRPRWIRVITNDLVTWAQQIAH